MGSIFLLLISLAGEKWKRGVMDSTDQKRRLNRQTSGLIKQIMGFIDLSIDYGLLSIRI